MENLILTCVLWVYLIVLRFVTVARKDIHMMNELAIFNFLNLISKSGVTADLNVLCACVCALDDE